jgi:hypothetical protein
MYPTLSIGISHEPTCTLLFLLLDEEGVQGKPEKKKKKKKKKGKDLHLGGLSILKRVSRTWTALGAQPGCSSKWSCLSVPYKFHWSIILLS